MQIDLQYSDKYGLFHFARETDVFKPGDYSTIEKQMEISKARQFTQKILNKYNTRKPTTQIIEKEFNNWKLTNKQNQ